MPLETVEGAEKVVGVDEFEHLPRLRVRQEIEAGVVHQSRKIIAEGHSCVLQAAVKERVWLRSIALHESKSDVCVVGQLQCLVTVVIDGR